MPADLTTRVNITKIGVISDTHIPTRAKKLPAALHEHFKNTDFIVHCGDIVEKNVLFELGTIAPVYAVKGNMDSHDINEPLELTLLINNKFTLCAAHGTGSPFDIKERLYKKFLHVHPYITLFGHTHTPEISKYLDVVFFNPGSCTHGTDYNSVGILDVMQDSIECKIIPL